MQVTSFLSKPNIPRQLSPLDWWKTNQPEYKRIAQIAQRYLAAPSTSVASERLFSCAGDIYSDSRCSLAPERAEMLLFIRNNMRLFC